jgi:peptidoglycan/xylan/chitin deacetylase (PgdA/CDA1 family)
VVLTFDDGYADNLWNARPLLEKYEIPATVFVTSGSLDSSREFWWDDLERALLEPKKLPKSLKLRVLGRSYEWPTTNSNERQHAYMYIHQILQPLSVSDRNQVMNDLFAWVEIDRTGRPDYRPLTTAELIQLGQSELIDIGAHTVTHPFLSLMPEVEQHAEIAGSRNELEEILGRCVDTFSYPYGNLSSDTVTIVAKAGFVTALTIQNTAIILGANPLILGRFCVGDWTAERFRQRLDGYFGT